MNNNWQIGSPVTMAFFCDEYAVNGENGMASTHGDTWDTAWRANGKQLMQNNDGGGWTEFTNLYQNDLISVLNGTPEEPLSINGENICPGSISKALHEDDHQCHHYSSTLYEINGALYHIQSASSADVNVYTKSQQNWLFYAPRLIKSIDGGKSWFNTDGTHPSRVYEKIINHLGEKHRGQAGMHKVYDWFVENHPNDLLFHDRRWGQTRFVKYGQNGLAPDIDNALTYAYLYANEDGEQEYTKKNTVGWSYFWLARIKISNLDAWMPGVPFPNNSIEFYKGGDGMVDSCWTYDITAKIPIFEGRFMCGPVSTICYNPDLCRYIMITSGMSGYYDSMTRGSSMRVLEAPHPWGPWTIVLDENMTHASTSRGAGFSWSFFMHKFIEQNGKKMWVSTTHSSYKLGFAPLLLSNTESDIYDAEDAVLSGGVYTVTKNHPFQGFSGNGYITGFQFIDSRAVFKVNIKTAGRYIIKLRYLTSYTLGKIAIKIYNNINKTLYLGYCNKDHFPVTGWTDLTEMVWLEKGENNITIESLGYDMDGALKLDNLTITLYSEKPADDPPQSDVFRSLKLIPNDVTLIPGESCSLTVIFTPKYVVDQSIDIMSSDENIVIVNPDSCIITGVAPGNAAIMVKSKCGNFQATSNVTVIQER